MHFSKSECVKKCPCCGSSEPLQPIAFCQNIEKRYERALVFIERRFIEGAATSNLIFRGDRISVKKYYSDLYRMENYLTQKGYMREDMY